MADFANPMIKQYPLVWFIINLLFAICVAVTTIRFLFYINFVKQGGTILRIRIMKKIILDNFYQYLATRITSTEERDYESGNTCVSVTFDNLSWERKQSM